MTVGISLLRHNCLFLEEDRHHEFPNFLKYEFLLVFLRLLTTFCKEMLDIKDGSTKEKGQRSREAGVTKNSLR